MPRVNFWGREAKNGEQGPQAECPASMCAADAGTVEPVLPAEGRECAEPAVHGDHQQAVPGNAVVWLAANGAVHEAEHGHKCGRHRVRRLMRLMRLVPIYQEPNTSKKHPQHKIWPYLLRNVVIDRSNQVWCADITYIPMRRGLPVPRGDHGLVQS